VEKNDNRFGVKKNFVFFEFRIADDSDGEKNKQRLFSLLSLLYSFLVETILIFMILIGKPVLFEITQI